MDIVIKFFDEEENIIKTMYFDSRFLQRIAADDLIFELDEYFKAIHFAKSIQLSLDGPNVNLSVINKWINLLKKFISSKVVRVDNIQCTTKLEFVRLDTIYTIYFNNSPATRGKSKEFLGKDHEICFPKKYYSVRWLENSEACNAILKLYDKLGLFVLNAEENNLKVGR